MSENEYFSLLIWLIWAPSMRMRSSETREILKQWVKRTTKLKKNNQNDENYIPCQEYGRVCVPRGCVHCACWLKWTHGNKYTQIKYISSGLPSPARCQSICARLNRLHSGFLKTHIVPACSDAKWERCCEIFNFTGGWMCGYKIEFMYHFQ